MKNRKFTARIESSTTLFKIVYTYELKEGSIEKMITAIINNAEGALLGDIRCGKDKVLNLHLKVPWDFDQAPLLEVIKTDFEAIIANPSGVTT